MKSICRVLRTTETFQTKMGVPYRIGLTRETVGATGMSMHVISLPPGATSQAHMHSGHESMLYMISGEVITYYGEQLTERIRLQAGDLFYIPAGCPHININPSKTEPCVGVVARTDSSEQENVVLLPELDHLLAGLVAAEEVGHA